LAISEQSNEGTALNERLAEVIEEFSEANTITSAEVLQSLEYVYACVERYNEGSPGWLKMH
jgi:F420-0:gamma-glutamyl ligase-like protein